MGTLCVCVCVLCITILRKVVRGVLLDKVVLEQRLKADEKGSNESIWKKFQKMRMTNEKALIPYDCYKMSY